MTIKSRPKLQQVTKEIDPNRCSPISQNPTIDISARILQKNGSVDIFNKKVSFLPLAKISRETRSKHQNCNK